MRKGLFVILVLFSYGLFAQVGKRKLLIAQGIFNNLIDAYASNKSSPALKILPKNSSKVIAHYVTYPSPTVQIDETVYDICMSFGKDSANALAIVLGHELAHYYNDHSWCSDYAFALRNSALGNTLNKVSKDSKIEKESIADSYGLFYSSLAGYKPFDIFNLLLDKIYIQYKLPEVVPGYPSKKERKEINRVQKEKIQKLVPVFEAGIVMLYLKHYEEAASCFEYLTKYFPSREMYNNYGVCKMSQALNYKLSDAISFIYPVEIDASSRIYSEAERGGDTLNRERKFTELLLDAKNAFTKAISLDPKYIISYINLACLYDIRGNYQAALGVVNEVEQLTSALNSDLQLIKAIALFHVNNLKEARLILKDLTASPNSVYKYNYQLFTQSELYGGDSKSIDRWKDSWVKEWVISKPDTCDNQYKILNSIAKDKITIPFLNINEFLSVGRAKTEKKSILVVQTNKIRVVADLSVDNNIHLTSGSDYQKFRVNNGKCFSINLARITWHVAYKELQHD